MATLKDSRTLAFTLMLLLIVLPLCGVANRVTVATAKDMKVAATQPADGGTTVSSSGAYPAWRNFAAPLQVTAMAADGNYMWLGTSSNVEEMDINSGAIVAAYTHADGLPLGSVTAIAVESNGMKWFTFGNAVTRFDGTNWQTFTASNSGLLSGTITAIAIDSVGNKWITLDEGLAKFDNSHWLTYTTANSPLTSNDLTSIAADNAGDIWIGSNPLYDSNHQFIGGGLFKFDGTHWQNYTTSNSPIPGNDIVAVAEDKAGNSWQLTYNAQYDFSLSKFDGTNWYSYPVTYSGYPPVTYSGLPNSFVIDGVGNKWIGLKTGSIHSFPSGCTASARFDGANWHYDISDSYGPIFGVDKDGTLWAGAWGCGYDDFYYNGFSAGGVGKFNGTTFRPFSTAASGYNTLFPGQLTKMSIDKSGRKWFTSSLNKSSPYGSLVLGDLIEFDGANWKENFIENPPVSLALDSSDNVWTLNGGYGTPTLYELNNSSWLSYTIPSDEFGSSFNLVRAFAIDKDNNKWIGTTEGALAFNGSTWISYTLTDMGFPQYATISDIFADSANNKWIASNFGVSKFDGVHWITYTTANSGLLSNSVDSIVQDKKSNIWFGSSAGISKLSGTTWVTYTTSNSGIATGSVNALATDKAGNLWVGLSSGLSRFDGNTWQNYNSDNSGLYSNNVNALATDSNGNLWVGDGNAVSELLNLPAYSYSYPLPSLSNNANGFTSYLAVQNANAFQTDLALQYYNANGNYFSQSLNNCVGLVAQAECLPPNVFSNGNKGTGVVLSTQPLNIIVAEATPAGGSAYAPTGNTSSSLIAPLAIKGYLGFTTQLTVFNTGSTASNVSVQYYSQDGSFQNSATQTVSIPANSSYVFDQSSNTNLPSGFYGWAQITGEAGSQLVGQVLEQNSASHFVAIATMAAKGASTLYAPAIFNNAYGGFVTGANIVNPNNSPAQATLTFYDHNGAVANVVQLNLQAHAITPLYQGDVNSGLPSGFYGSAVLSSTYNNLPLVMVVNEGGSVTQAGNAQSGTYSAVASGSKTVALPVMANNGFGYTTGTTILNTSNSSVSGTIQYFNLDGTAIGAAQPFTIAANASQPFYQGAAGLPSNFYGTAVVTQTSGTTNSLVVTTNAQSSAFFYTYTEPS